jgi:hypothetical protein
MKVIGTIVTRSYLSFALALAESLRRSGNHEKLFILLADRESGEKSADGETIQTIGLGNLVPTIPLLPRYYFTAFELCSVLKPYLITYLFQQGAREVIYLDSDIMVVGSLAGVWEKLAGATLSLSPHHLIPPPMNLSYTSDLAVSNMGILNSGFYAMRNTPTAREMLAWLRERLLIYGFCTGEKGMFGDQKMLPQLLQYYPTEVQILRDPGLNVAWWNAHERKVRKEGGRYVTESGDPVVFFHMSGYLASEPDLVCSYLPRSTSLEILERAPWLRQVMKDHHALLATHGMGKSHPFAFASFNGMLLTPGLRRILFRKGALSSTDSEVWKVRLLDCLRTIKRKLFPYRQR